MKQLVRIGSHAALWVLALVVLASTLGALVGVAAAASPTYTLSGAVEQPGAGHPPVPSGVQVDVVSKATGALCTTTVASGGLFKVSSSGSNPCSGLAPGFWGVFVPVQTNLTLNACRPFACAILPQNSTPVYYYQNASQLTKVSYAITVPNVAVLSYTATLRGNVTSQGNREQGAIVSLLAAKYNGVSLVNNTTDMNGSFTLKVPFGTWVLQTTFNGVPTTYNYTQVTVANRTPTRVNPQLNSYVVQGRVSVASTGAPVPNVGNVTLIDPTNQYIYSSATAGGFYSTGTYPAGFTSGTNTFDVVLATSGYTTNWFYLPVSAPGIVTHDLSVSPLVPSQLGVYATTLNLSKLNLLGGSGNISVVTGVNLGNNSVLSDLPNGTVSQLWAQLGLDWAHSVNFSSVDNAGVQAWLASSGPTFPAVQAGLTINGTGFLNPTVSPTLANFSSSCLGTCNPSTVGGSISYGWHSVYAVNGTFPKNSSAYSVSFGFAHPTTAADVYNYSVVLPADYVLAAGTTPPAQTSLSPTGPNGTWTKFTLSSLPSSTPSGTATFSIVKAANLTANVNVSVKNFAFSSKNVLNGTHANYTVVVGVGQNVTFSALNSTYPAGTNGTKFVWDFGDASPNVTKGVVTANHTYASASGSTPYTGTLTVTSSGGQVNNTKFKVWVAATGGVTAKITGNWTSSFTTPGPYARINWSTPIQLNATGSTALISPTAPVHDVISVASWTITAKGYKSTQNFSASTNGVPVPGNWTPHFLGAGNYYTKTALVGGSPVTLTGWEYNVSLTVWSGTGQSNTATFNVLVNDTEKPTSAFVLQNAAGKAISGTNIQVGKNDSVKVQLNAANATDPHNGSLVRYYWLLTNPGNTSVHWGANYSTVKPNGSVPSTWLNPQLKPYLVNLTVWDLNGNHAYANQTLTVSVNTTFRVLLASNNLTAPSTLTSGTSYTIWVNVTVGGGSSAVANNVTVSFYTLSPSGTGNKALVGGSPQSVRFYNYVGGVVNSTVLATGAVPTLGFNKTVRAEISWNPGSTGNFVLYANATASNEFAGDYANGPQTVQQSITVNPNPTTTLLIDIGIGAAAVAVIVVIYLVIRSRRKSSSPKGSGRSGQDRKSKEKDADDDDEDEDDEK